MGTNLKANEKEKANSYGNFIEINERAKSFGSTVKKKIEKAETIIYILIIIAIEKDKEINNVFRIIMNKIKKDKPRILFIHCLNNLPKIINGIKLKKIMSNGISSVNNNAIIVYMIANNNLALGSKLCKNDFFS